MKGRLRIFVVFILFILMLCTITACGKETGSNVSESSNSIDDDEDTSQFEEPTIESSASEPEHVSNNEYFSTYREVEGYTHTLSLENHMTVTYSAEFPSEWQKYNYSPLRDMERYRYYLEGSDNWDTYSFEVYINPGNYGDNIEGSLPFVLNEVEYISINGKEIFHGICPDVLDYDYEYYIIHSKHFYGMYSEINDAYIIIRFDIPYDLSKEITLDINNIYQVLSSFEDITFSEPDPSYQREYFGDPYSQMDVTLGSENIIGINLYCYLGCHRLDEPWLSTDNSFQIKHSYDDTNEERLIHFTFSAVNTGGAKNKMTTLLLGGGEIFYVGDYFLVSDISTQKYYLYFSDLDCDLNVVFSQSDGSPIDPSYFNFEDIYTYIIDFKVQAVP